MVTQLAILFGQNWPWIQTTLETSKEKVEARMIIAMEQFMRASQEYIDSFKTRKGY